jgi:hypothetical protein
MMHLLIFTHREILLHYSITIIFFLLKETLVEAEMLIGPPLMEQICMACGPLITQIDIAFCSRIHQCRFSIISVLEQDISYKPLYANFAQIRLRKW